MRLSRPVRAPRVVSIVPLVDVLLILLVFFMVTSRFLDLDMIAMTGSAEPAQSGQSGAAQTLLLRIVPGGDVIAAGQRIAPSGITDFLAELGQGPPLALRLLSSPQADVQALVTVLDAAAAAGLADVQVIQLGAEP
ncbi:MAG: biopolymer transporter ExbD [Pseudomonadota bacterium]